MFPGQFWAQGLISSPLPRLNHPYNPQSSYGQFGRFLISFLAMSDGHAPDDFPNR